LVDLHRLTLSCLDSDEKTESCYIETEGIIYMASYGLGYYHQQEEAAEGGKNGRGVRGGLTEEVGSALNNRKMKEGAIMAYFIILSQYLPGMTR
jgi:hypothetical protein